MTLTRTALRFLISISFSVAAYTPANAGTANIQGPAFTNSVAAASTIIAALHRPAPQRGQVIASTVRAGCKPAPGFGKMSMIVGAQSRCLGGSLTRAEKEMAAFENRTAENDTTASLALRQDPRRITKVPLTASAGFAMALSQSTQIGVEYSFSQRAETSPFHFRNGGGFADETAGHSARLHVGLKL